MDITIAAATPDQLKPKPVDESQLGFGDITTDHIFLMDYDAAKGWFNPRIEPYGPLAIDPAAMSLHYGQEIFEGLKAYAMADGGIGLFRAGENFERLNRSAARLCMPNVDIPKAMEGMKQLILLDKDWIPKSPGTSLYIRPTMIATEPHLGVRPSNNYLFFIIIGPVGAYYKEGLNPVKIYVEDFFVRAAIGGTGEAKLRSVGCREQVSPTTPPEHRVLSSLFSFHPDRYLTDVPKLASAPSFFLQASCASASALVTSFILTLSK